MLPGRREGGKARARAGHRRRCPTAVPRAVTGRSRHSYMYMLTPFPSPPPPRSEPVRIPASLLPFCLGVAAASSVWMVVRARQPQAVDKRKTLSPYKKATHSRQVGVAWRLGRGGLGWEDAGVGLANSVEVGMGCVRVSEDSRSGIWVLQGAVRLRGGTGVRP